MTSLHKAAPTIYEALHRAADALEPRVRLAFLRALEKMRLRIQGPALQQALLRRDVDVLRRLGFWQEFEAELTPAWRHQVEELVLRGGQAGLGQLPPSVQVQTSFDLTNPLAVQAIDTEVASSLAEIVTATQAGIQTVLRNGFTNGVDVPTMARQMRQFLGVTDRGAAALQAYEASLLEQGVPAGRLVTMRDAYAQRLIRQRATVIARTETIRALNVGQHGLWNSAAADGLLDLQVRRIWIVTPDDALCPICEALGNKYGDQGVGLGETFDGIVTPPAHPQCRCAIALAYPEDT